MIQNKKEFEFKPWECSNLDTHSVEWPQHPKETAIKNEDSKIDVSRRRDGSLKIDINAPSIELKVKLLLNMS